MSIPGGRKKEADRHVDLPFANLLRDLIVHLVSQVAHVFALHRENAYCQRQRGERGMINDV